MIVSLEPRTRAPSTSASTISGPASSEWKRHSPAAREYRRDAVIAACLFAATLVSAWLYATVSFNDDVAPAWVIALWAAAITLPLAFRRRIPEIVAIVASLRKAIGPDTPSRADDTPFAPRNCLRQRHRILRRAAEHLASRQGEAASDPCVLL